MRLLRTDPVAGAAVGLYDVLLAALIAWLAPLPLGLGLAAFASATARFDTLGAVAVMLMFVPVMSWIGLAPGALALLGLLRLGWGGLAPLAGLGALAGGLIGLALYGAASQAPPVFAGAGLGLAALAWGIVRLRRPEALR